MTFRCIAVVATTALAGCEPSVPSGYVHERQQTSASEPGVRISGSARVGVAVTR